MAGTKPWRSSPSRGLRILPWVFRHDRARHDRERASALNTVLACNGALMPGYAFSIEDALVASRWADQVRSRGYRVVITPDCEDADETIEVYIPNSAVPAFRLHRNAQWVSTLDCMGLVSSSSTLTDALLAIAPLSRSGRQAMLKGARPAWLPLCPTYTYKGAAASGLWSRMTRTMLDVAKIGASRGRSN